MRSTVLLIALAAPLAPLAASAADTWTVLPFKTRGLEDPAAAETFRELFKNELGARNGVAFAESEQVCADAPCAQAAGAAVQARVAVYGHLSTLGTKIIVTVTVVDVATGQPTASQRMTVDRVEDLEAASVRMASAIVEGKNTEQTAELGAITQNESQPDKRREGASGMGLRLGGVSPIGDAWKAGFGIFLDLSYWYEARNFAIEPRVGFYGNASDSEGDDYFSMPIDIGAYYILGREDFAPFIGGGGGIHYVRETRVRKTVVGTVTPETSQKSVEESAWGAGAFGRAGVMLFRTYTVRMNLAVEYQATFVDLHDAGAAQNITFGVGVVF